MYTLYIGKKTDDGEKLYVSKSSEQATASMDKAVSFQNVVKLEDFLDTYHKTLQDMVLTKDWKISVEQDGKPFAVDSDSMEMIDYYLTNINLTAKEVEEERVRRLKLLHLETTALKDAIENKTFYVSERTGLPWNVNYYLAGYSYEKEVKEALEKVKKYGGVPYWGIVDHMKDGSLWISILFVSLEKTSWKYEVADEDGLIFAGVYNTGLEDMDFGSIVIHTDAQYGSVKRIA